MQGKTRVRIGFEIEIGNRRLLYKQTQTEPNMSTPLITTIGLTSLHNFIMELIEICVLFMKQYKKPWKFTPRTRDLQQGWVQGPVRLISPLASVGPVALHVAGLVKNSPWPQIKAYRKSFIEAVKRSLASNLYTYYKYMF